MAGLAQVLLIGFVSGVVIVGLGKMAYQLKRIGSPPPRPRQPWEYGGPT